MRLLDLFCGAGGCSVGYNRAGFDVTGVDIDPHPDYPYEFIHADAMEVLDQIVRGEWGGFDVIHASPPCPAYSAITSNKHEHPDLVGQVRDALREWGGTYVIENVPGAPLIEPLVLCGEAFGLGATCRDGVYRPLRRHRLFESNVFLMGPGCACSNRQPIGVYGSGGGGVMLRAGGSHVTYKGYPEEYGVALGIDWMGRRDDLANAIPPAYTEYIGRQVEPALAVTR
jgi:DNA (cytosine-5)-methyltransferase 1